MAHNTTPLTGVEHHISDSEFIITQTDKKGIITYCNDVCLRVAGYTESEILGKQHNILRHPEMPRCIFKYLWENVSAGDEVLAYVVNKCKNGDHYWVFAHVTPTYDNNGNIIGYYSNRRPVKKSSLDIIKPLYKELLNEETKYSSKKEGVQAGLSLLVKMLEDRGMTCSEFALGLH